MTYLNHSKGYTLLFAVIVSSIVLAVAVFIVSASRKQFVLSSSGRDSTVAIYAADSGIQCAVQIYHDNPTFASPYTSTCNGASGDTHAFKPGVSVDPSWGYDGNPNQSDPDNPIIIKGLGNSCAVITITEGQKTTAGVVGHMTVLEARGYNSYDFVNAPTVCPKPGPRIEERAIHVIYDD